MSWKLLLSNKIINENEENNNNNKQRKNMNNFKKIGLSALAGSLVAFSVNAADLSVTGGASVSFGGQDKKASGNGWSMNDSATFAGSAEMDNGFVVSTSFLLDNSDGAAGQIFDDRSMTIDMGDSGTILFSGQGGVSAMHSIDDMLPYADTAGWDMMTTADGGAVREGRVTGTNASNMMRYTNSSVVDGLSVAVSYVPSNGTVVESTTSWNVQYSGVEGLTVGYGQDENGTGVAATEVDTDAMFAKYVYGPVTVGYQKSEDDAATAAASDEFSGYGISYAVSDDLSVSFTETTYDLGSSTTDEETTTIGASYTMGSMTLAATMVDAQNIGGSTTAINDVEGYDFTLSFAF
jgi:outer membrane protein OmpU